MDINKFGQITVSEKEAFNLLYNGEVGTFAELFLSDPELIKQFNQSVKQNADPIPNLNFLEEPTDSIELFDESNRCDWFMPKEYHEFPMEKWLLEQCNTTEQRDRVLEELALYIQHDMYDVLFYLKYLVDTLRANNIVWGVGRGSSVASYILYLIGIHKIDSIKYELDINEFLK